MANERIGSSELLKQHPITSPPFITFTEAKLFQLYEWKTPDGVDVRTSEVILDPEKYKEGLQWMCPKWLAVEEVIVENGMPAQIILKGPQSRGRLVLSQINTEGQAEYQLQDVKDPQIAVALQVFLAQFVNYFSSQTHRQIPYIDGKPGAYFPVYLGFPPNLFRSLSKSTEQLTDRSYQTDFLLRAQRVATFFGRHIRREENFSKNGLLRYLTIQEGDACFYALNGQGEYYAHNVDSADDAILLQWCVGMSICDLVNLNQKKF